MSHRHVCHGHTTQWFAAAGIDLKIVPYAADEGVTCVQVSACLVQPFIACGGVGASRLWTHQDRAVHLVSVVHGLYVSLQHLTELAEDDLQNLGKMAGLNIRKRRQLINAVQELRKV